MEAPMHAHNIEAFGTQLLASRLVAILRGVPDDALLPLCEMLVEEGWRLIEVPLSDPGALGQIEMLRKALPADVHVGAGTVMNAELSAAARDSGAGFLVTPHASPTVIRFAAEHDLGMICGAMTPTDIALAREAGARFIKLFPASALGPGYVKQLLGPYSDLEMLAVGGIGSSNLRQYLDAGVIGAGVGGALVVRGGGDEALARARSEARALVRLVC